MDFRIIHRTRNASKKFKGGKLRSHVHGHGDGSRELGLRMYRNIFPRHYTLCLKPNLTLMSFEGCVAIHLDILKDTQYIYLNVLDLNVSKIVWEEEPSENRQEPMEFDVNPESQVLRMMFEPSLLPSSGNLRINFNGPLNDLMLGFYRSKAGSNGGPGGTEEYNAVTKFEPTEARRCFPCLDDPLFKATFDISLIVPRNLTTLSNMPVKLTYPHRSIPELHVVEFERSPRMSTYLVATVVGHFEYIEAFTESGIRCRVYTSKGKSSQGSFALDICTRSLQLFEETFGLPYPLKKMDLVAVADHISGAMENWGLVIFRDSRLLIDEETASLEAKVKVSIIVCHEIAHQWFGNLVTMEWWTHLWLNEGYATFMEFVGVSHLHPEYEIWSEFINFIYMKALRIDGLKHSHPIEVPVKHPSEIKEIFDTISYNKGASIIRMLYHYLGPEPFRAGIHLYLSRFQYKNARTDDLWQALEDSSQKPVISIMQSWTRQTGFPLIRITGMKQDKNGRTITLTQEKFWSDPGMREGAANKALNKDLLWTIPITFSLGSNPKKIVKEILMEKRVYQVTLHGLGPSQWFKVNPGCIGFYRVKYPSEMFTQFVRCIRNRTIPPMDRIGLLSDLYAMAEAGISVTSDILSMLECFSDEDNYSVWLEIENVITGLDQLTSTSDGYEKFRGFARAVYRSISEKYSWESVASQLEMTPDVTKFQILVLNRLIELSDPEAIAEAIQRFERHITGEVPERVEYQLIIYKAALGSGNTDYLRALIRVYRETESLEEKIRVLQALGCFKGEDSVMVSILEFAISDEVRRQDAVIILEGLGRSKVGRDLVWNFFKEKWTLFRSRYQGGQLTVQLIRAVSGNLVTEEKAGEVQDFFHDHQFPGTERTVLQIVERIRIIDAWSKRDLFIIMDYLGAFD